MQPGAGRRGCAGIWNDHLRIAVQAPPADGRANRELVEVLAEVLGLRRADVRIERGHASRNKIVALEASVDTVRKRILSALSDSRP